MNGKIAVVLLSGLVAACAQPQQAAAPPPPPPAPAAAPAAPALQGDRYVQINRATCETLIGLQGDDREDASMFYIGYVANHFRTSSVNVSHIPSIIGLAVDYCQADPQRTVVSAFHEAYREVRTWKY
jgi:hypothetical protein